MQSDIEPKNLPAIVQLFLLMGALIIHEPGQENDALVDLVSIWEASESPADKDPDAWMRLEDTAEYIDAFVELTPRHNTNPLGRTAIERAEALGFVKYGSDGKLYAHNEIALEYAQFLDQGFRAKVAREVSKLGVTPWDLLDSQGVRVEA